MKFDAFAQLFREKTVGQNDSTAIPNATITLYANQAKDRLARQIVTDVSNGADYFSLNLTTSLEADKREYSFPNDVLKNIRVVQAYIGDKWRRVFPFDINSYRLVGGENKPYYGYTSQEAFSGATDDETTITEQFTDENPQFDVDGKSIILFSETIDAVSDGLKLKALIYPKDFEDSGWTETTDMSIRSSTTTTAMPRQSHDVLLAKAVIDYKEVKNIPLTAFEADYLAEEQRMIDSLSNINDDETITAITPIDNGWNY